MKENEPAGARPSGRRAPRRRILLRTLVGLLVLGVLAVAVAYFVPVLGVRAITVEGVARADAAAITRASGIREGDNMLRVDTTAAARNVAGQAWVERVTVARHWPRTIAVQVTEHDPAGVLKQGNQTQLVDTKGNIFLSGAAAEGVPEFRNIGAEDSAALHAAATAVGALPPEVRAQLEAVEAPGESSVKLLIKGGKTVFWGTAERAAEKAEATRIVLTREGTAWNVSNPAMPTVR
ncbi:cell division protein FtsQ/DivIB [Corynebacterium heidelbergense]|uniref:Cell division protein FtsQ n=1 Tax=Corynebacterium heidelbergense TaxID=2055947 RepID=A0A364V6T5_9CORY|nr:FtsQ-type POTRA domain-containing protein [Corynebacterium heidelbergense]RAV32266.1 cell division protein FtsQ [Corynebacterium heidelbergense]